MLPSMIYLLFAILCGFINVGVVDSSSPLQSSHLTTTSRASANFGCQRRQRSQHFVVNLNHRNNNNWIHNNNNIAVQNEKSWFPKLRGGGNVEENDDVNNNNNDNNNNGLTESYDDVVEDAIIIDEGQEQKSEEGSNFVTVTLDESFPSPLRNRVQCISIPKFNVEIFLLGTAHISRDSAQDATWLMQHLRPDCLFVELCHQRTGLLLPPALQQKQEVVDSSTAATTEEAKKDKNTATKHKSGDNNNDSDKNDRSFPRTAALSSVLLTKIQSDYATKLNVTIGGEFHAAYECASQQQKDYDRLLQWEHYYRQSSPGVNTDHFGNSNEKNGCVVVLGDRPVKLTLLRAWESLRLLGKLKLLLALLWSSLRQPSMEELKEWMDTIMNDPNSDLLTKSIEEMKNHFPSMERVIIQERDLYMTHKLYQTARILSSAYHSHNDNGKNNNVVVKQKKTIVAVVGAGHCGGMLQHFGKMLSQSTNTNEQEETAHQQALASLVETKRYKVETNEFVKSLTTDITQLQYPN